MDNALDLLTSGIGLAYSLFTYLLLAVSVYVMAKKDGLDTAWLAWIPIINVFVMLQIADMDWWYILLFLVPCINLVVWIMMWWRICEARGKPGILSLLMLVPVLNLFLPPFLAFTD